MEKIFQINPFYIAGISIRTTNKNGQAGSDLTSLWSRFYEESIPMKVSNPIGEEVYAVYTKYSSDYQGDYTAFIGLKIRDEEDVPKGLERIQIGGGKYREYILKGEPSKSIPEAWSRIWENDNNLKRRYTSDFEVYGEKSGNGSLSEIKIYLAVNE